MSSTSARPSLTDYPRKKAPTSGVKHFLAGLALKLGGWKPGDDPPDLKKYVFLAVPHTSWWDGIWMVTFAWWWGIPIQWLVKADVAPKPMRWFFELVGGVLVDRSSPQGLVADLVQEFRQRDHFILAVPPEGTRKKGQYWKSGFYFIAKEAGVPIVLANLDYGTRTASFGPCFVPTGDMKADMDIAREFYRDSKGLYPEKFTAPRLREEDKAS